MGIPCPKRLFQESCQKELRDFAPIWNTGIME